MSVYKDLEKSLKNRTEKEQEKFNRSIEKKYRNMSPTEIEVAMQNVGNRINELKSLIDLDAAETP
jgi:hypothetical protein